MELHSITRALTLLSVLVIVLSLSGCGTPDSGRSSSYDEDSSSVVVGGRDGWWIDAPVNSSSSPSSKPDTTGESE